MLFRSEPDPPPADALRQRRGLSPPSPARDPGGAGQLAVGELDPVSSPEAGTRGFCSSGAGRRWCGSAAVVVGTRSGEVDLVPSGLRVSLVAAATVGEGAAPTSGGGAGTAVRWSWPCWAARRWRPWISM